MPSSRPKPDCLKPPNGVEGRTELFELTERTPVSSAAGDADRAGAVARPDRAGEAVGRVVGDPDRVGLVVERDHGRDRAEDLLAGDPVVVRRLDERAREPEARAVRDFAPESGWRRRRGTTPTVARCSALISGPISVSSAAGSPTFTPPVAVDQQVEEAVVGRALDEDARAGAAVLAGVVEDGVGRRRRRRARGRRRRRRRSPTCRRARA